MKRHHLASLVAVTIALAAGNASAQSTGTPTAPPAAPPAPAPAASPAAPTSGSGAVRIHVHTLKNKGTARLYSRRGEGQYTLVCASPCTADVPVNSEMRVTLNNNDEEPHTFVVSGELGSEIDLEVRPASVGPLIGGIVMMGSGGAFILSGLLFLALADITDSSSSSLYRNTNKSEEYQTIGYVFIGLGAAAAAAGLVWLLTRSHEPRITDSPRRPGDRGPDVYGRNETLLGDIASLKPRDARTFTPAPFTPLRLGFSF
jgi:hypothetical protein